MRTVTTLTLDRLSPNSDQAAVLAEPRLCAGCDTRPPPRDGRLLCTRCETALPTLLTRIRDDYGRLELQPGRHGSQGERMPVGFASKPPCAVNPLSLRTVPRWVELGGHIPDLELPTTSTGLATGAPDPDNLARAGEPTLVVLGRVADRCREHDMLGALAGPRTVIGESLRLERVCGEIAAAWWAGSALRALRSAARDLTRALGEDDAGVPLGTCPVEMLRHGAVAVEPCAGPVRSYEDGQEARCRAGHRWSGPDAVRELAAQLGDAWLDAPAVAEYLSGTSGRRVSSEAVRKRAARQCWTTRTARRVPLYRLVEAQWSSGMAPGPVAPPEPVQRPVGTAYASIPGPLSRAEGAVVIRLPLERVDQASA